MHVERYTPEHEARWEEFVSRSNNGTLFHTRRFFQYHPPGRFQDHSLIFRKKGTWRAVFPAAEVREQERRLLWSHPGASYGSLVVPEALAFREALDLISRLVEYARREGFEGIRLTLPPTIYQKRLSNYIDYALLRQGFTYSRREVSSILFLESTVEANLAKFKPAHRRAVKKALRSGVTVRESEEWTSFYRILQQNLWTRHNVNPTHTLDELVHLKHLFPDRIRLFGAYLDRTLIAGVVNFICNRDVVMAFYISHDEAYAEYRPVNLLFYSIFDWAIREGFRVFDFGIFTVREEPNLGLARFKENFGASGLFRDTLELRL
ncbi:MAG: GNAT family N-acetyltransferase [Candidatus Neomarinimicrobiota bacterium]|nr:MAG: GNAT family N-acetyltransferase [Candidatus Neomarinimicrobiota bacterium]